jgi:hypothetical protein
MNDDVVNGGSNSGTHSATTSDMSPTQFWVVVGVGCVAGIALLGATVTMYRRRKRTDPNSSLLQNQHYGSVSSQKDPKLAIFGGLPALRESQLSPRSARKASGGRYQAASPNPAEVNCLTPRGTLGCI